MRSRARVIVLGVVLATGACGPIEYVNQVTRSASSAVSAARAADAEKLAPYWWTRAVEYLHEARALAAHSDFQAANRFGRLSTEAAVKARDEAIEVAKDPSKGPLTAPPAPAPAPTPAPPAAEPST